MIRGSVVSTTGIIGYRKSQRGKTANIINNKKQSVLDQYVSEVISGELDAEPPSHSINQIDKNE